MKKSPLYKKLTALPHQRAVLASNKRYIFLGGGVGCGKTEAGSLWVVKQAQQTPPGVLGCIAANSYTQLTDSTLRNLYRTCERVGMSITPATLPFAKTALNIVMPGPAAHKVVVLCRSLESYHLLAGVEFGWVWVDECFLARREAVEVLMARLRDTRMPCQMLFTTTLDEPGSWMHSLFVEQYDPELMEVIYATTFQNRHLPPGYVDSLKRMYPARLYDRMVLSKWVALSAQAIYHSFDRGRNLWDGVALAPELPLLWSHDFNLAPGKPMSSVLAQLRRGEHGMELHVLDEIVMETADTNHVIAEMKARPWQALARAGVIVYGDASGRARDTRSGMTDYSLLAAAGFAQQKVPRANPPVRERHNLVNCLLCDAEGRVRLKIHPRCATLARGLERAALKQGAQYVEDDSLYEQHVTTALGYLCCAEFKRG
ncbi:phage terminase large subunit [Megalodesulfovibrio paquesii]